MYSKFFNINDKLVIVNKHGLKVSMENLVSESLLKVKDSVIEVLCKDNAI